MSSSKQRLAGATVTRLAAITDMEANLKAQLSELNRLRDQLRKAQLSVPEDRGAYPTEIAKTKHDAPRGAADGRIAEAV